MSILLKIDVIKKLVTVSIVNYLYFVILLSTCTYLRIRINELILVYCIQLFLDLLLVKSIFKSFAETP